MMLFYSKFLALIFILLSINPVNALENISLEVEQIKTKNWQLKNIQFSLLDIPNSSQQLTLLIKQIALPEPFSEIKLFDIQCRQFSWQENEIACEAGKARVKSDIIHSDFFNFTFNLTEQKSRFSFKNLKLANGKLSLIATEKGQQWFVSITAENLNLKQLNTYLSKENKVIDEVSNGRLTAKLNASGNSYSLETVLINTLFKDVTLQANNGKIATELIDLDWNLQATKKKGISLWNNNASINQGELYIEPVYLEIKPAGLSLKANGKVNQQGTIKLQQAEFIHPDVIALNAQGLIKNQSGFSVDQAHISSEINDLELFSTQYLLPFIEQTTFEGLTLKGGIDAEIDLEKSAVTQASINIKSLTVQDTKKRFAISNANGAINWSVDPDVKKASKIQWDQVKVRAIPIEASQLKFLLTAKQFVLLEQSSIPLLGGSLEVKQFKWQKTTADEPKVYFEGGVNQLSLEKLSTALDWTTLSGEITGYIPGVDYESKTLTVNGELQAQLFGGTIKINKLTSSGLFTDFSKFSMDMEIDNLDLYEITQKFEMGGMEGRVSGFIKNLYLENWEPVTFYAWLGTPENDDSTHKISQKAVENIASIGGGGAADVISKGFLRFFDTFGYDRLGFGCYLHQGVCQLMGVEAAEQGYYIVKGGGIPRIDIMGYNPQVDWKVLMERLSRITSTEDIIVE